MKENRISNNVLIVLVIATIFVSVVSTWVTLSRVTPITGLATSGKINLTVSTLVQINFTTDVINWSDGSVTPGLSSASLNTSDNAVSGGNWTANNAGLVVENVGNVNVTLDVASAQGSSTFIGGTSPDYEWNFTNSEDNSCADIGAGFNFSNYTNVNSTLRVCDIFEFVSSKDALRIDFYVRIPSDSNTGALGDTITVTAAAV